MIIAAQGLLQVTPINDDAGYLWVKMRQVEIVNLTNTVVHIINPNEITEVVNKIERNIENLNIHDKEILKLDVQSLKAKIKTITFSTQIRNKRGLINGVGTIYKWLFGTMDDIDRQEIVQHLEIIDTNNHNAINNLNKQIHINTHFNDTITQVQKSVNKDMNEIEKSINKIRDSNIQITGRLNYLDYTLKLKTIDSKISEIQNNIASAVHNTVHPGILTKQEIEMFKIDFNKLKLINLGVMNYKDNQLIIAIKIPKTYLTAELKMITPLPNATFFQIEANNEYVVQISNSTLTYTTDTHLNQLKISKHCIFSNTCNYKYNNKFSIDEYEEDLIIVKNAQHVDIKHTCDDRKIIINKNNFITFYNCEISIDKNTFYNHFTVIEDKYFYPNNELKTYNISKLELDRIKQKEFDNLAEIQELHFHKKITYGINGIIIIIIIVVIIITIYKLKSHNIRVNIQDTKIHTIKRIQENSNSGGGEVTLSDRPPTNIF